MMARLCSGALVAQELFQGVAVVVGVRVARGARKARALHQRVVGEPVMEDGVAVAEQKTQGGNVGGVPAYIDDAVLHTVELGKSTLQLAVGRAFAAHQTAGSGRGAIEGGGLGYRLGNFRMGVDVKVVVCGKIEIFPAVDKRCGLGRAFVAEKQRIFHPHPGTHFHQPIKGEFGTHAGESGGVAVCGGCGFAPLPA